MEYGLKSAGCMSGPRSGREAAIQASAAAGLEVNMIKDVTPIPTMDAVRPSAEECNGVRYMADIPVPFAVCAAEGTKLF